MYQKNTRLYVEELMRVNIQDTTIYWPIKRKVYSGKECDVSDLIQK